MGNDAALESKLKAALVSREHRGIRRRLPAPSSARATASTGTDFSSNDYLSLSSSPLLRQRLLAALQNASDILGSGGSRLLVNPTAHADLEARLKEFFGGAEEALLFNSGFDANAAFFASVPQPGDVIVLDELIHASVHDGVRASRVPSSLRRSFAHNDPHALRRTLEKAKVDVSALKAGQASVFVAVESVYSMDGTLAPLREIVEILEEVFPRGNAHLVVDEAHATGVYGPQGRGLVCALGLEERVFARLHTFGKALAATGAVLLTSTLVRDYLLNYARPLIYTTALSNTAIIAASCSFDLLSDGTASALAFTLHSNTRYLLDRLRETLALLPTNLVRLPAHLCGAAGATALEDASLPPAPIIPLLTPHARALSTHLAQRGLTARPIVWPTVPRGTERVRVCLQANTPREALDALVEGVREWAEEERSKERAGRRKEGRRLKGRAVEGLLESKL
ncbi:PLP-dependent transferase [Peniophora sp. CONT]|nr:PLP-dependent transferase [Peniophora sp. CONT]